MKATNSINLSILQNIHVVVISSRGEKGCILY